jgi:hypothetical protein
MDAAVGSDATPRRRGPNHPTGAAERQRQGGQLELKIEGSRAPTPCAATSTCTTPCSPRPRRWAHRRGLTRRAAARRCRPARAVPLEVDSGAAFHRARRSRFPERSVLLGPPPARVIAASHESGRLRRRPRTLARHEDQATAWRAIDSLLALARDRLPSRSCIGGRATARPLRPCPCKSGGERSLVRPHGSDGLGHAEWHSGARACVQPPRIPGI